MDILQDCLSHHMNITAPKYETFPTTLPLRSYTTDSHIYTRGCIIIMQPWYLTLCLFPLVKQAGSSSAAAWSCAWIKLSSSRPPSNDKSSAASADVAPPDAVWIPSTSMHCGRKSMVSFGFETVVFWVIVTVGYLGIREGFLRIYLYFVSKRYFIYIDKRTVQW